jgi:adenine phosphoribosyltransferase
MKNMNTNDQAISYLKSVTRSIKDHPKKGIIFRDLTTIFQDNKAMGISLDLLEAVVKDEESESIIYNKIVGVEARGFVLAGGLVGRLGGGVVMARKPGKLPYKKKKVSYQLEYGEDALEIHVDAIQPGERIIVLDDLLATGGTAEAACKLVEELGGNIVKVVFLVELPDLNGRAKLVKYKVDSILQFEGH